MSEVVNEFPPRGKYDWQRYNDGQIHKLTRGVDFECTLKGFINSAASWAETHNLSVSTRMKNGCVWLQFSERVRGKRAPGRPPGPPLRLDA